MPPPSNFFSNLQQPSPQTGPQQQQQQQQQMPGGMGGQQRAGGLPSMSAATGGGSGGDFNLPSTGGFPGASTSGSGSGGKGGLAPLTNSPRPPPSNSEAAGSLPAISSPLPSVESKKEITKLSSPSSSGYQGSSAAGMSSSQSADPLGGLPSLPSEIKMEVQTEVKEEPKTPQTAMSSLPSVDSKKDIIPNKLAGSPASVSRMQNSVPPSQGSSDTLMQGSGVPSLPESKPSVSAGNQKIVPDPSLRKGERLYVLYKV